ncbi:MAG TPA: hypothetical protein VIN57_00595, partial [Magnetovibrio sp.]
MSTVTPVPNRIVPSTIAGTQNTTAVALNATQVLQGLQAGQSLQATITALISANQVQTTTALGQLTLQTNLPLPPGAVLTLVLTSQSPQPTFQITAVNGKPVQGATLPGGQVQAGQVQGGPQQGGLATLQPSAQLPTLSPGATITVTLLRPALGAGTGPTANAQAAQTGKTASPASATPGQSTTSVTPTTQAGKAAQAPAGQGTAGQGTGKGGQGMITSTTGPGNASTGTTGQPTSTPP